MHRYAHLVFTATRSNINNCNQLSLGATSQLLLINECTTNSNKQVPLP